MITSSSEPVTSSSPSNPSDRQPSKRSTPNTGVWRVVGPIFSARTWSATWFLAGTLFVGLWWFVLVTVLVVFGLATLVLAVGVPVLVAGIAVARAAVASERQRVGAIGFELPAVARFDRHTGGGWTRLRADLSDPATYRSLAHVLMLFVLGPIWFSLTVTAWAVPLSLIATPLMLAVGFEPSASAEAWDWEITIDSMTQAGIIAAVGVVLLPITPRLIAAMAGAHGRIVEGFVKGAGR